MVETYQPELGQALFGQPAKEYAVPDLMLAVLGLIRDEMSRVVWNITQQEPADPFGNTGASFANDTFSVQAYSWGDEEQPWNFKWGDLEVGWYKYLGRGMSANVEITPQLCADCLAACLASLEAMDTPSHG